jgi:hypothetical protein
MKFIYLASSFFINRVLSGLGMDGLSAIRLKLCDASIADR